MFFKKFFIGVVLVLGFGTSLYAVNGIHSLAIDDASYISQSGHPDKALALLMAKASNIVYEDSLSSYDQDFFGDNGFANLKLNISSVSGVEFLTATRNVVVNGTLKRIVFISFRGTAGVKDLWTDASLQKTKFMDNEDVVVHGGFHGYFKKFRDYETQLKIQNNEVLSSIVAAKSDDTIYLLTGHSLGGAIAKLYAASLKERGIKSSNILVYTFGAPPVGHDSISASETFSKTYQFRIREDGTPYSGVKVVQYRNYYDPIANLHRVYFKDGSYLSHIALSLTYAFDESGELTHWDEGCKYTGTQFIVNVDLLKGLIDSFTNELAYSLVNSDLPNCDYTMGAHSLSKYIDNLYKNIDFYAIAQKKIDAYIGTVTLDDVTAKAISDIVARPTYRGVVRGDNFYAKNLLELDKKRLIQEIKSLGVGISADSFGQEGEEIRATIKNMVTAKNVDIAELKALIDDVQELDALDYTKLAWGTAINVGTGVADVLSLGSASAIKGGIKVANNLGAVGRLGLKLKGPLLKAVEITQSKPFIFVKLFVEQGFTLTDEMMGNIKEDEATASLVNGMVGLQGDLDKAALELLMQNNKSKFLSYLLVTLNDIITKVIQGSTEAALTDNVVHEAMADVLKAVGEMAPVLGPIYAQYNLAKKVSDDIDTKPKVINAWNSYLSAHNALINDIRMLGDSWFSVRLDAIVSSALSQYRLHEEKKKQELEEIENNRARLDFILPAAATLEGYSIHAQTNETVSFSPYITAKGFTECINQPYSDDKPHYWTETELIEMHPEDTLYKLWYYDNTQSKPTKASLTLTYDREKNNFSFSMPSDEVQLVDFTLNHKNYDRFVYGCGFPDKLESANSDNTTGENIIDFNYIDNFNDINRSFWYSYRANDHDTADYSALSIDNGVLIISQDRTDNGPTLISKSIPVDNNSFITIKRRVYLHSHISNTYGGEDEFFVGGMHIVSSDDTFGSSYTELLSTVRYYDYEYQGDWDTFFLQDNITENQVTSIWDNWFDEELTYNTKTNESIYKVNEQVIKVTKEENIGSHIKILMHTYGWWTGHYTKIDNIEISVNSLSNRKLRKISWFINGQKKKIIPEGISGTVVGLFTWWGDHSIRMDLNNNNSFEYDFNEDYPGKAVEPEKLNLNFTDGFSLQDYELWNQYWEDPTHGQIKCYWIDTDGTCTYSPYGAGAIFFVNEDSDKFTCENNVWKYNGQLIDNEEIYCIEHEVNIDDSILDNDISLVLMGENYTDGILVISPFIKEWYFSEVLDPLNLTINVLENSYQNTVSATDFTIEGNTLKINLTPDLTKPENKLLVQFTDADGNIVKVSNSDIFWSSTKTNHAPRLADGQITQLVSATNEAAFVEIATYDADGDSVALSIEDDAGGTVSLIGNRLTASFSDGQIAHTIKIGLNDGKELIIKEFNVLQFDQASIDTFYSDVDKNAGDYIYDGIAFGTLKGVVWGQPDPNDATKRIFKPTDSASLAEALAIVIRAEKEAGLIDLDSRGEYLEAYPSWAMKYYTFARETNALDKEIFNLAAVYPTREMIARMIVKTLNLDNGLKDSGVVKSEFTDSSLFSNAQMQYYGDIVHTLGLFMTGTTAKPQETISRAELAMVIQKIFMIPTASVSLSKESIVQGEGTVGVTLIDVQAQAINSNYNLYDSKVEVSASVVVGKEYITTLPLDSSALEIGQNTVYVVLDNNGVKKVLTQPLAVFAPDDDGDQVLNSLDRWLDDARYAYDENGNGIPDILDTIFSLSTKSFDGNTTINGQIISIANIISNGGYSPDSDGDGINDDLDPDIDGDGTVNLQDAFPNDPAEYLDTDNDGTGNNADTDDDGDGVLDSEDDFPLDNSESLDTDNDGIGNNADEDDDGDGVLDNNDDLPLNPSELVDTDHDGTGNNADKDDDNDGISDTDEIKWGFDPLDPSDGGDADTDGDGVSNADEIEAGSDPLDPDDTKKPKRFVPIMMDDIVIMVPLVD